MQSAMPAALRLLPARTEEFYVQATRPSRPDAISHEQAVRLIQSFGRFDVQDVTSGIMTAALATRHRFEISYLGRRHHRGRSRRGLRRGAV
jgi:hypothetical protein